MSRDSYARRRENLMKDHPFCHWCGREVVYFKTEGGPVPENFATIDHINTRLMHPDGRPYHGRRVLSCHRCNHDRNVQEERSLGKEELTRRSQGGHRSDNLALNDLVVL